MTKLSDRAILAAALAKAAEPIAEARRTAVRKQQIDDVARQVVALHDRLCEQEIAAGVRTARPVRKTGMTLAARLQEIVDEGTVAKRTNGTWRGIM
jgi:hypothetical protein